MDVVFFNQFIQEVETMDIYYTTSMIRVFFLKYENKHNLVFDMKNGFFTQIFSLFRIYRKSFGECSEMKWRQCCFNAQLRILTISTWFRRHLAVSFCNWISQI